MKKQTVSLLVFLLAISCFFVSCGNIMNKNAGALEFDSIRVNKTTHLFGDTAKPGCNLIISLAYANQSSDVKMKDSLNAILLAACFGEQYAAMTPEKAVKTYSEKYANDYLKDLEPMYQKDEQEKEDQASVGEWYSYYKGIESHIQLYIKDLLVYHIYYSEYTGGAHGMYTSTYLNMNLKTLSPIRLDDLFVSDYKEVLTDLLWNQLMADNNVKTRKELEDMGYGVTGILEPTENFYLSKQGITFHYNVYEITPYAMGPVKITLPYDAVEHLLGDDSAILNDVRNS